MRKCEWRRWFIIRVGFQSPMNSPYGEHLVVVCVFLLLFLPFFLISTNNWFGVVGRPIVAVAFCFFSLNLFGTELITKHRAINFETNKFSNHFSHTCYYRISDTLSIIIEKKKYYQFSFGENWIWDYDKGQRGHWTLDILKLMGTLNWCWTER